VETCARPRAGSRNVLGSAGEDATSRRYVERGFRVVARNWRCSAGELDLVLAHGELLVFCEVKTRSGAALGAGFDAVTARKQRKLRKLAEIFLANTGLRPGAVRFDVASVTRSGPGRSPNVELFEDAF
jgi:putative endonuclease